MIQHAEAVLFDLDGTLVDTPRGICSILARMFPVFSHAELNRHIGRPLNVIMADLSGQEPDSSHVEHLCADFRRLFTHEVIPAAAGLVFDGIIPVLTDLRVRQVPVGVVTSKSPRGAEEMIDAAGLSDFIDVVIGYTQDRPGKPAPDQALAAATELGVAPQRCLVVGDSTDDIQMATAAAMPCVGVSYGVHAPPYLIDAGAPVVYPNAHQLGRHLRAATARTGSHVA